MHYTAKYFRESMPEWKKRKDPVLSKLFYRPVSFFVSALAANRKWSANDVSYFSLLVGVVGCLAYLPTIPSFNLIGAILINAWLVLDCTDGNMARSLRKQPFGEFADGISSYVLVGLMSTCVSINVYFHGGLIVHPGFVWIILIGAIGSNADTMMRLVYQKYKATERGLAENGSIKINPDVRTDRSKVGDIRVRIEAELGIGGILPLLLLICTVLNVLDLFVVYCFLYYGGSALLVISSFIKRAKLAEHSGEENA